MKLYLSYFLFFYHSERSIWMGLLLADFKISSILQRIVRSPKL